MKSEKIIKKRGQDLTPWHQGKQGLLQLQIWPRAEEEEEEKEEEKKKRKKKRGRREGNN